MAGYSKLWSTIVTSSVWSEDDKTRIMWITMLAVTEADGHVSGSIPGMAAVARLSITDTQIAIDRLCAPDPYSRSLEFEGRRITESPGGWQILNYDKYRASRDEDERKAYMRDYMKKYRKQNSKLCKPTVNPRKPPLAQAEAEAEAEAKKTLFSENSDPVVFSETLLRNIKTLGLTIKEPDIQKWAVHIDRMIRIDKILPHEITQVLEWIFLDPPKDGWPGWGSVILSTANLREKWSKIISRMKAISQREDPEETLKRLQAKGYC